MTSQPNPMVLNNPMLSINYRIWVGLGYLCQRDSRRLITLLPSILMEILQISYLIFSGDEMEMIAIYGYLSALHFNCMFRVLYTITYRERFEKFLDDMSILYNGIMDAGNEFSVRLIEEVSVRAASFSKLNICLGFFCIFCQGVYPQILGGRIHPYGLYVGGVNFKESPLFEITYVVEMVITLGACMFYIPFCNLFASFILFGIALIGILKENFRTIADPFDPSDLLAKPNDALIERRFRLYIEYHKRIIRYVKELNAIVSTVCLIEIIIFGTLLCGLLFIVQIVDRSGSPLQFALGVIYICLIIFQLFTLYWLSNELIEQSTELLYAIYDCPWFCFNIKNQKTMVIIMARLQLPMEIMVGNIAPITLQTFQSILNVSYSYFTILRRSLTD